MQRIGGGTKRLELVCTLCNDALADLERECAEDGYPRRLHTKHEPLVMSDQSDQSSERQSEVIHCVTASDTMENYGTGRGSRRTGMTAVYGGYQPLTSKDNLKNVIATKCGHMFHQGCLRKHVHKMLIAGKGGSLFCPICTRPFAMNRLWPVIVPATKSQKERFVQLKMMKEQNTDMVGQLKEIRAKIAVEEQTLEKLKEESEQCLKDIQQKQKLLNSVTGPTNKELTELTKLRMTRQETLHVLTQHNADLLKLLVEESNNNNICPETLQK